MRTSARLTDRSTTTRFACIASGAEDFFLRSNFSNSRLVRLLGGWTPLAAEAGATDFAERLSLWVNAFDAIGLQAAQQSIQAIRTTAPARASGAPALRLRALQEDFQRARATLAAAIAKELVTLPGEAGFSRYQQRHLELQRQMEMMIAPLREHVRQVLGQTSAALRKLAALDTVFEHLLAPREQALLPTAAALLQRRFEALRAAEPPAADWLDTFERDWRQALLAELDLRLEPIAGLIEALANELNTPR